MIPVHYLSPERTPSNFADFPARTIADSTRPIDREPLPQRQSTGLLMMTGCYVVAMFLGLLVLHALTALQ